MRWDLTPLYESIDSPEIQKDFDTLKEKIENLQSYIKNELNDKQNAESKIERIINDDIEILSLFYKLECFASLTVSTDVKNEKAQAWDGKIEKLISELTEPFVIFDKWMATLPNIDEILKSNKLLTEHSFYIKDKIENTKYLLDNNVEIAIAKLTQTGSGGWTKLYNTLSSTQVVDIEKDGKTEQVPLPIVRNMAYDKDPEVRKKGYEAELKSYAKVEEGLAASINCIKGEVIELAKMRGYDSVLDQTLTDARLDKKALSAMLEAIQEMLPKFHKFLKHKAKELGHKNGLPFYDLFAPSGNVDLKFTFDETREFIVTNFKEFSEELASFANTAFEENWIDAEPREGKMGGGFCANIPPLKQSRILTNFTGVFSDVGTLAHELGHAYHGNCLNNESILNTHYTMPIAETASIFCESIVNDAFLKKSTNEEKKTILASNIGDATQCIVDIYSRYLFETTVFEKREESALSVNELKDAMTDAQKKAFGDGLDHNHLHPYMWACKPHYYYSGANFYNFPYAFGLLFAKGLYSIYLKEGESFVDKYNKLLSVTGKNDIVTVTSSVGIDITNKKFWLDSLQLIVDDIEEFCSL